ncbi:MAG: ABC transporter ATP-binding protein [Bacteroidales bacterium]|nr:ABC transporter ATP-binding protein [Bacteroidales bacterium]
MPTNMQEILSIRGLSKSYKNVRAIQNLDLQILEGQAYGILGPNGSGKTTTLSIVMGIIRQEGGHFSWFGEEPVAGQRRSIGSLIETPHFYPYLNLERNLRIICDIKGMPYGDIGRVLETAQLTERKRSRFSTLSLGMKQRLGIAAALLGDPRVLVLDEPTNGLDPEGIAEVREIVLQQVQQGKTLILASHILSEVEKICSHVAILKKGELLANGPVKELLAEDEIIEISCNNNDQLKSALKGSSLVKEIETENGVLILTLNEKVKPAEINSFAFDKKLVVHHMLSRKRSLESQFLELVKEES